MIGVRHAGSVHGRSRSSSGKLTHIFQGVEKNQLLVIARSPFGLDMTGQVATTGVLSWRTTTDGIPLANSILWVMPTWISFQHATFVQPVETFVLSMVSASSSVGFMCGGPPRARAFLWGRPLGSPSDSAPGLWYCLGI